MDKMKMVRAKYKGKDMPEFSVGDTVKVYLKIIEEGAQRVQAFEGIVIGKKRTGPGGSFTLRRISYGEGMERTFLLQSPNIEKIEVLKQGKVKRAKLYYLRKKIGKKTTVKEKIGSDSKTEESTVAAEG